MLSHDQIGRCARLPTNYSRPRFIANYKRRCLFNTVLFSTVNLNRRMISGRTKQMSLVQISSVNVRAGIDDECRSTRRHFNAQRIVVAMRTASAHAAVARVKEQVEIVFAKNVSASFRKRLRRWDSAGRQRLVIAHALRPKDPK